MNFLSVIEYLNSLKYFLNYFRWRTIAVFFAAIALAGLEMISTSMLLPLLTLGTGSNHENQLISLVQDSFSYMGLGYGFYPVFFVLVAAFGFKIIGELVIGIFIANTQVLIARSFRKRVIDALNKVSFGYLTEKPHGLIINLLSQEVDRATSIFNCVQRITVSALMSLAYITLGLTVSTELLIAAALMGCVGIFAARPMMTMARKAGAGHVESLRNISSDLTQGMQAFKAFKAMGQERKLLSTLTTSNDHFVDANLLKVRAERFLGASQQFVFLIIVVSGVVVARDLLEISLVEIGFMAIILLRLNASMANMLVKVQAITNYYYTLNKFDEFSAEMDAHAEIRKGGEEPQFPAPIKFENVNFNRGDRSILKDLSLTIPSKGLTTIIGPSGSGKTTIIDLICGFHSPDKGRILIGDHDLEKINIRKWRQMIGYVSQEPILLHNSIAQNVAAFDTTLSQKKIIDALEQAGALSFVEKLSEKLETNVGVGGQKLSGGERQRITVARALAKQPKLLILDEPTASVDPDAAVALIETIKNISRTIPVIAISHQTSLSEAADVLYRINNGNVEMVKQG